MAGGKYPVVTGLEHDEWGHPTASPELHQKMTDRRRDKIKALGEELPAPEIFGEEKGDVLLVGWGSTWGPIREATIASHDKGLKISSMHLRNLHPMPNGLGEIFKGFKHVCVVEINDEGLYGHGQLATLLRARYCDPRIESLTKTNGLTFKIAEIVGRVQDLLSAEPAS